MLSQHIKVVTNNTFIISTEQNTAMSELEISVHSLFPVLLGSADI